MKKEKKKNEDEVIVEDDFVVHNTKKADNILKELDELDLEPAPILSANRPKKQSKKDKEIEDMKSQIDDNGDDWLATISSFKTEKLKKGKTRKRGIFDYYEKSVNGKKKKKKKKDEPTDYSKEFENEARLLKNLLVDQNKFVDSLQKKYDAMEASGAKSPSRAGIGKFTTDLIMSINSGRGISMNLIEKLIGVKKTIADLTIKERKELAAKIDDSGDLNLYSANFLKQMLNEGRASLTGNYDTTVQDSDPEALFDIITDELGEDESDNEETDKYLEYENRDVKVHLIEDTVNNDMWFEAMDGNGNTVEDYPLPKLEGVNINRSTNVATDKYGRKYPVEYV